MNHIEAATMVWLVSILALFSAVDECKVSRWKATVTCIDVGIREFELTYGQLPTKAEGLRVLVEKPFDWSHTQPWLPILEATPLDPWGHEFCYILLPEHENRFGFYSLGADGVTFSRGNDPDDINSWNEACPWFEHYDWASVQDYFRKEKRQKQIDRYSAILLVFGFAVVASLSVVGRIGDRRGPHVPLDERTRSCHAERSEASGSRP